MKKADVIKEAEVWARSLLEKDATGHDWYHVERVRAMAVRIAKEEGANMFLVELIALLHEMPDKKLQLFSSEKRALNEITSWLVEHGLKSGDVEEIVEVISRQSYSKSGVTGERLQSKAGQVVQDADRLEAIGAIGIARCFAYGGARNRPLHLPTVGRRDDLDEDSILNSQSSLQHFYEKLLHVKDTMNTATGRRIAKYRHRILTDFLEEFLAEWEGNR